MLLLNLTIPRMRAVRKTSLPAIRDVAEFDERYVVAGIAEKHRGSPGCEER